MKTDIRYILTGVVGISMTIGLMGCASEAPFEEETRMGGIRLHTVISNVTTRATDESYADQLKANCMVYISRIDGDKKGLVYKKRGLENFDGSVIPLNAGQYVAEAWSGDSVAASTDKKFFRGYIGFDVTGGAVTQVTIPCPIKNVLVVIDKATIAEGKIASLMKEDYKITVSNKEGHIDFTKDNLQETAYFMMSDNDINGNKYELSYEFTGTRIVGNKSFTLSGTIPDVKSGYRYTLTFKFDETYKDEDLEATGGSKAITIQIDEKEATTDDTSIYPSEPTITWVTTGISDVLDYSNGAELPDELALMVCAVGDRFGSLTLTEGEDTTDLLRASDLQSKGLDVTEPEYEESTNTTTGFILFKKNYFEAITAGSEKSVTVTAKDLTGKEGKKILTIRR